MLEDTIAIKVEGSNKMPVLLCNLDEDYNLDSQAKYTFIHQFLEKEENIDVEIIKRLLSICVSNTMNVYTNKIVSFIMSKIKAGKYDPAPDLLPSALAILSKLKVLGPIAINPERLKMYYDTLLLFPEDTLVEVTEHYEDLFKVFNHSCNMKAQPFNQVQTCSFLHLLLKIMPSAKRKELVERGISIWFSNIIPSIMANIQNEEFSSWMVELLELLTEDLVNFNYKSNQHWHRILEFICNAKVYPNVMKNLLLSGKSIWCRIWIVFIRLLKHQITESLTSVGTPINSMLPVVEVAFKQDILNRCKAFECWTVLIDSFAAETVESNINKRIKLLLIPLKSNNAKAEQTALAKFKCWWHLIRKFENKMDKFLDSVLVSFLQFCFGRHNTVDKTASVPGQLSLDMKMHCNQAVVDIFGHIDCDGCTDLPKLKNKIINTKHLVDNWNHWIYSLTLVIMKTAGGNGLTDQQLTCLWKSFLITIGELPPNNIRKDLFAEILSIITHLLKQCKSNNEFLGIVFNILILSLFNELGIKHLFKSTENDPNDPIFTIVAIIFDSSLHGFYNSLSSAELTTKFKIITKLIMDPTVCNANNTISKLLPTLPRNDYGLMYWNALEETLLESEQEKCPFVINNMLLWPLTSLEQFNEVKMPALTWYKTYDLMYHKLNKLDIDKEISPILATSDNRSSTIYFQLCIALGILKHKFTENSVECEKEMNLLLNITKNIDSYNSFEHIFPMMVDRIVGILSIVTTNVNDTITALILVCVKNLLHVLTQACKQESDVSHLMILIGSLLRPLESLFNVESYSKYIPAMTYHLIKCSPLLSSYLSTQNIILNVMQIVLKRTKNTDSNYEKIKLCICDIESSIKGVTIKNPVEAKFSAPQAKEVSKKTKKKEANIVNTVMDNGEEYVVVKSNWKFNPRKLTEKQKEKFQRKREDIPALYQDLSQSQDEFKLATWKTDSQDTTSSSKSESKSSKAVTHKTDVEILETLASTDVVPKILENLRSEKEKANSKEVDSIPNINKITTTPTSKNVKSPRMALKDRVFRNVKNLIESNEFQKQNKDSSDDLNRTDNVIKTPTQSKDINFDNVANSAPPLLSADRPSRVKRKPKKFEDLHLLGSKKRRHSLVEVNSDKAEHSSEETHSSNNELSKTEEDVSKTPSNEANHSQEQKIVENDVDVPQTKKHDPVIVDDNTNKSKEDTSKIIPVSANVNDVDKNNSNNITDNLKSNKGDKATASLDVLKAQKQKIIDSKLSVDDTVAIPSQSSQDQSKESLIIEKDVSTSKTTKPGKEDSPAVAKNVKGLSTPKRLRIVKKVSTPKTPKDADKNLVATENKEVTLKKPVPPEEVPVKATKNVKESAQLVTYSISSDEPETPVSNISTKAKEQGTPKVSKDVKDLPSTKTPKNDTVSKPTVDTEIKELSQKQSKEVSTPKQSPKSDDPKSTTKKSGVKKSRIEKELAIDMVQGHPYLKIQSDKRMTRKALESASTGRRKSLIGKINKSKSDVSKNDKKGKEKNKDRESFESNNSVVVNETQEKDSEPMEDNSFSDELPHSEDVIESSQDSSVTTISVKSTRKTPMKVPLVYVEKMLPAENLVSDLNTSQSILECGKGPIKSVFANHENKDDTILPLNKTVENKPEDELTENMDTEPMEENNLTEDVILVNNDVPAISVFSNDTAVGPETQELAELDTQTTDPKEFMDIIEIQENISETAAEGTKITDNTVPEACSTRTDVRNTNNDKSVSQKAKDVNSTANNTTLTLPESVCADIEQSSSPFKDEEQRQKDFLNNTFEISPIKTMSPDRNKKSPSPETSSDFVVIKLSSPVQSNGEPFEKLSSPEVFTEEKMSPDKRDQSPPRVEISVSSSSPSSSLSLKKNRPQVRSGGRAAQMLGLCVPDKVQSIVNPERKDTEEVQRGTSTTTPVRRNLRIFYNSVHDNAESSSSTSENDDSENFLKFSRSLPAVDSSPSGPILKRKLAEITDDAMVSPASKRKRVSFHDPPVSTTISVQKYIEPIGVRSPQNSAQKRLERQLRQHTPLKSPKRLENVFKLDSILTKTVESFADNNVIVIPDDTELTLSETPVVEIVRVSELNDIDPICPDLVNCTDSIEKIAAELSSPTMKSLLLTQLQGTVDTVGDLAKMTELEINRLCIKTPKVKVAKKALTDYAAFKAEQIQSEMTITLDEVEFDEPMLEYDEKVLETAVIEPVPEPIEKLRDVESQTVQTESTDMGIQTQKISVRKYFTQTETVSTNHAGAQTHESGSKSTAAIITSCLNEKPDFIEQLSIHLDKSAVQHLSENLPLSAVTDLLTKKATPSDTNHLLNRILENSSSNDRNKELSLMKDYICSRFDSKDLVLLCSEILKVVYDKPA